MMMLGQQMHRTEHCSNLQYAPRCYLPTCSASSLATSEHMEEGFGHLCPHPSKQFQQQGTTYNAFVKSRLEPQHVCQQRREYQLTGRIPLQQLCFTRSPMLHYSCRAPYCCAGSLTFSAVTVCCPPPEALLISFPASEERLHQLSALCQEATFGKGKQDVLDPSYRRALALGNDKFFTNFDLASQDILATIKSVMMPDAVSIRAELYKLNIYRPGDFFKAHVDTPRGQGMFGSLVVCLPQQHTGGELLVRPKGEEQRFDFAAASSDTVQWAAFYSDCEHEILPVQSGHRITLTYNLYAAVAGQLNGPHLPGLDSSSLRLHGVLAHALATPDFLPKGGELAVPCEHVYPHTHEQLLKDIPAALKGQDALCFKVLQQLGLSLQLQAVHHFRDEDEEYEEEDYEEESKQEEGDNVSMRPAKKAKVLKMRVGDLMAMKMPEYGMYSGDFVLKDFLEEEYGKVRPLSNVVWLEDKENLKYHPQIVMGAYGNEIYTDAWYSAAAVFASVPAWDSKERAQLIQKLTQP